MVNWSSPDIVAWKKDAIEIQQELYEKLGDRIWDYIKEDERWALEKKVGYALFREPSISCDDEKGLGYTSDQVVKIRHQCNLIYEKSGKADLNIAFLFVIGKSHEDKFRIPVIKVRVGCEAVFIDPLGRTYKNWSDFKENNNLPKSLLCYPLDGKYQSTDRSYDVLVEFSTSPACNIATKVCGTLDKVSSGVGIGATFIGIAGLAVPIIAPIAVASGIGLAASGAYGLVRGSQHLHDRRTHDQTLSPTNSDARNCWLSVFGGIFGVGSTIAVTGAAALVARGGLLGTTSECIIKFLNIGSLTVNGVGIFNGLAYLVERQQRNELTALDIFQWSASVFFFYNAAVNIRTANGIVRDVQEGIKSDFTKDLSKRRIKAWNRVSKESIAQGGTIEGNAKLIKGITSIGSKDEFFRLVIKGQRKFDKGIKFNQDGLLITRGQLFFDTKAGINYPINYKVGGNFFNIPGETAIYTSKMCQETMTLMETVKKELHTNSIIIDENIKFELNAELMSELIKVLFRYSFSKQDEGEKKEEIRQMLTQTEMFARKRVCSTEETFISYHEFICIYKKGLLKKMKRRYESEKADQMFWFSEQFDEAEFNIKWNIQDSSRIEEAFLKKINDDINLSMESLLIEFDKYNGDIEILNESGNVQFYTCAKALIQFYRCFVIDLDERLTLFDFFDIIRKTVENESLRRLVNENESCRRYRYYDKNVPVIVEVQEMNGLVFFETTDFKELDETE